MMLLVSSRKVLTPELTRMIFGGVALIIGVAGLIRGELLLGAEAGEKGFWLTGLRARILSVILVVIGLVVLIR